MRATKQMTLKQAEKKYEGTAKDKREDRKGAEALMRKQGGKHAARKR
jgi:hypothetical protein